jgi:uncharacterized protein YdhG (YjbR/CyaY superfamily)
MGTASRMSLPSSTVCVKKTEKRGEVPQTVDDYIRNFPREVQTVLRKIRKTIRTAAPQATEFISYNMPAYRQNGVLLYFAAFRRHIGLYPTASGMRAFAKELTPYKRGKGSVRFPLDQPIPYDLIAEVTRFRLAEDTILATQRGT